MAFLEFKNVRISGISAGVPKHIEYNKDYPYFEAGEAEKYIASTSVRERRIADPGVCSSDLCYSAAERLIEDLGWDKSEIECLLFVSQTADYILPYAFDKRVGPTVAKAVAEAAVKTGVNRI